MEQKIEIISVDTGNGYIYPIVKNVGTENIPEGNLVCRGWLDLYDPKKDKATTRVYDRNFRNSQIIPPGGTVMFSGPWNTAITTLEVVSYKTSERELPIRKTYTEDKPRWRIQLSM